MTQKEVRLEYIRRILNQENIRSQEDLLKKLAEYGYITTQATLSRDLQQMRAVRTTNRLGEMRYVLPDNPGYIHTPARLNSGSVSVGMCLLSADDGGKLVVLHTIPGFAAALAGTIDSAHLKSVAGTLAGDDTVLIIGRTGFERSDIMGELRSLIPAAERM